MKSGCYVFVNTPPCATADWTTRASDVEPLANLHRFLEVNRHHLAVAAVAAVAAKGKMAAKDVARALKLYKIDPEKPNLLLA